MTTLEWFLLFWIGMTFIRWLIVVLTYYNVVVKKNKYTFTYILSLIIGGVLTFVAFLVLWPLYLYNYRILYFIYPDMTSKMFFEEYYGKNGYYGSSDKEIK